MATTVINQRIEVCVVFKKCIFDIKWFEWKDRRIEIKSITHKWYTKDGQNKILHFAARSQNGYYELSYNTNTFEWLIEKTEVD